MPKQTLRQRFIKWEISAVDGDVDKEICALSLLVIKVTMIMMMVMLMVIMMSTMIIVIMMIVMTMVMMMEVPQ